MSDTNNQPGAEGNAPEAKPQTFGEEYVKELRNEAAQYRTKLREFEKKTQEEAEARLKEQGEYKRLYEEQAAKVKELEGLTGKLATYEAEDKRQFDEVKKTLSADSIALIDALPEGTSTRVRLQWAQRLAGASKTTLPPEARPGAGDTPSVESVVEAYKKGNRLERAKMLERYEHNNPSLYETLLRS